MASEQQSLASCILLVLRHTRSASQLSSASNVIGSVRRASTALRKAASG